SILVAAVAAAWKRRPPAGPQACAPAGGEGQLLYLPAAAFGVISFAYSGIVYGSERPAGRLGKKFFPFCSVSTKKSGTPFASIDTFGVGDTYMYCGYGIQSFWAGPPCGRSLVPWRMS